MSFINCLSEVSLSPLISVSLIIYPCDKKQEKDRKKTLDKETGVAPMDTREQCTAYREEALQTQYFLLTETNYTRTFIQKPLYTDVQIEAV
jgi:hypothetical protein